MVSRKLLVLSSYLVFFPFETFDVVLFVPPSFSASSERSFVDFASVGAELKRIDVPECLVVAVLDGIY